MSCSDWKLCKSWTLRWTSVRPANEWDNCLPTSAAERSLTACANSPEATASSTKRDRTFMKGESKIKNFEETHRCDALQPVRWPWLVREVEIPDYQGKLFVYQTTWKKKIQSEIKIHASLYAYLVSLIEPRPCYGLSNRSNNASSFMSNLSFPMLYLDI